MQLLRWMDIQQLESDVTFPEHHQTQLKAEVIVYAVLKFCACWLLVSSLSDVQFISHH